MELWEAVILGLVQGATEFLPVSSSGHLVVAQQLLGVRVEGVFFEVAVHVATLLSIVLVYRARLLALAQGVMARRPEALRYVGFVALATLPAALVGLGLQDALEAMFDAPEVVAGAFLVTGAVLWSSRIPLRRGLARALTSRIAIAIGVAQCLALVPGISRSGSTVVAALWLGVAPVEAAAFSFLMAIPAIGGAAVLQAPELISGTPGVSVVALLAGSAAAAVSGVAAIVVFVRLLERRSFHRFAPYLWVLGVAFFAWLRL